jgi:LmbE family N-acetylglucosaminyl deacetylase
VTHTTAEATGLDQLIYRSRLCRTATRVAARGQQIVLEGRAADITEATASRSCLVLAPHPDDETLGAGATIARKRAAGAAVRIVVVADGRHANPSEVIDEAQLARIRQDEAIAACGALGVESDHVRFAGFEDGTLDVQVEAVAAVVRDELCANRPEEVLVPSAIDGHPDHRALRAALRVALASGDAAPVVLEYPVWFWDAKAWLDRDARPAHKLAQLLWRPLAATLRLQPRAVRSGPYLDIKCAAFGEYRSQLTNLTGEASWPVMDPAFVEQFFRRCELFFAPSPPGR